MTRDEAQALLTARNAEAEAARRQRRDDGTATVEERIVPDVLAALADRIGNEDALRLTPHARAMQLASLAPSVYLGLHRSAQDAARSAAIAERYAPAPDTPEAQAAAAKLEADCALARRDYPAYRAQRDAKAKERMAAHAR